jgi:protoporphyrinogen oxidase
MHVEHLVIGAGPAGLGAAWRLEQRGSRDWLILEAGDVTVARAQSVADEHGFTSVLAAGRIRFRTSVKHIDTAARLLALSDGTEITYGALISTMPLDRLIASSDLARDLRPATRELESPRRDRALSGIVSMLAARRVFSCGRFGAGSEDVSSHDHGFAQGVDVVDALLDS